MVERLRLITSLFTQLFNMSTPTLKPRPKYKRTTTKRTMTEQTARTQTPAPSNTSLDTITKVQSHLPDVQLIDRNALWEDLKNRIKINNYEVSQAMKDLKDVVNHTHKFASPYVNKVVTKVQELRAN